LATSVVGDAGAEDDDPAFELAQLVDEVGNDVKVCLLILLEGREDMRGRMGEAAERKVRTRSGGVEMMVSK
jgi:hypothetical protein